MSPSFKNLTLLLFLWILLSTATIAQKKTYAIYLGVPEHRSVVVDDAGLLKPETVATLESRVGHFNDSSGHSVAVVLIYDLEGSIDSYARKIISEWRLGKPDDDAVMFLVVQKKREMRIEVGKGLIDKLTPDECNRTINNEIVPLFKDEKYDEGMIAGVESIFAGINGQYKEKSASFDVRLWMTVASIIIILANCVGVFSKYHSAAFYGGLLPFFAVTMGMFISWWGVLAYAVGFPMLRWIVVKSKIKQLTFGKNAGGGSREDDQYDRINRRNTFFSASDSDSGSSGSSGGSSGSSGSTGRW
jgi:uncharacterized membrane protein YgcG